jgi:hypothetical protein
VDNQTNISLQVTRAIEINKNEQILKTGDKEISVVKI